MPTILYTYIKLTFCHTHNHFDVDPQRKKDNKWMLVIISIILKFILYMMAAVNNFGHDFYTQFTVSSPYLGLDVIKRWCDLGIR